MEFTATRDSLLTALQLLMGVVDRKQTFPILSNVLLKAENTSLSLLGTDLEVELQTRAVSTGITEPGILTIPARKWFDILKSLPEGAIVNYRVSDGVLKIRTDNAKFSLNTLPACDFPRMEERKTLLEFEISEASLLWLIKKTAFSMAEQEVRHYLNGLFLTFSAQKITAVAADGHRLAIAEKDLLLPNIQETELILPRKATLELGRLLLPKKQNVLVQIGPNYFQIKTEQVIFSSRLLDAKFPPYQRLIPKKSFCVLTLFCQELTQALLKAVTLSHEKDHAIRLRLEENALVLSANTPSRGDAEVVLPVNYTGESLELGFNGLYLLEALAVMESQEVDLFLPLAGESLRIQEKDEKSHQHIIMPFYL